MAQKQYSVRLFVDPDLTQDAGIVLDKAQSHYVGTVMRRSAGEEILLFNGRDGEWVGSLQEVKKNHCLMHITEQLRPQMNAPDVELAFAPVKKIQNNFIVQKATELGVRNLTPVQTVRTQSDRMRADKMEAQVIEAAEQCERLDIPEINAVQKLDKFLKSFPEDRALIFCQERLVGEAAPLQQIQKAAAGKGWTVLIGPEGGFTDEERAMIHQMPQSCPLTLGPRILRAETAVISALTLLQAALGDWNS